MKGKTYNTIFFIIGLGTLAYMVYKIGIPVIWANIEKTGYWFFPVIGSWLIIYFLNALALREIIYEKKIPHTAVPMLPVLKLTISGYAINYITPFVALGGEPYRVMELRGRLGINKATSSVLLYTFMHMFSHIVFWMVSIGLILIFLKPGTEALIACVITFLVFYLMLYWVFKKYKKGLLIVTFGVLAKIPFLKKRITAFTEKRLDNLNEIDQHIIELFSLRKGTFYAALFFEFAGRVVGCLEIYFIALALGSNVSVMDSIIISAGSSLFANLIFFSPMQLGAREGGFVLALRSIGIAGGVGLFMSLVTRIREIVWIMIGLLLMRIKTKI
jgi:uncharacterized membrane protein YbhN (UPF0104 family)